MRRQRQPIGRASVAQTFVAFVEHIWLQKSHCCFHAALLLNHAGDFFRAHHLQHAGFPLAAAGAGKVQAGKSRSIATDSWWNKRYSRVSAGKVSSSSALTVSASAHAASRRCRRGLPAGVAAACRRRCRRCRPAATGCPAVPARHMNSSMATLSPSSDNALIRLAAVARVQGNPQTGPGPAARPRWRRRPAHHPSGRWRAGCGRR